MHKRKTIAAALLSCAAVAASAAPAAQADFEVGMADQDFRMFESSRFEKLGIDKTRFLVPYDWFKKQGNENEVNAFMDRAAAAGTEVLVHFTARRGCYERQVLEAQGLQGAERQDLQEERQALHREFPETREIGVWNEANHVSQPTARKPGLAAKYFLAARSVCRAARSSPPTSSTPRTWSPG